MATWCVLKGQRKNTPTNLRHVNPPSHFVVGHMASSLEAPDPRCWEVEEDAELILQREWRKIVTSLMKWVSMRKEYEFDGEGGVKSVNDWQDGLEKFFDNWPITNSVTQARLATLSFKGRADKWWRAHRQEKPQLVVSFARLVELVKIELVPNALPAASHLAWKRLPVLRQRRGVYPRNRVLDDSPPD